MSHQLRFWVIVDFILLILTGCALYFFFSYPSSDSTRPDLPAPTSLALLATPVPASGDQSAALNPAIDTATVAPTPVVPVSTPTSTPLPSESFPYTVQEGEHLAQIARNFGVGYTALLAANPDIDPDLIHPGQVIIIPGSNSNASSAAVVAALPPTRTPTRSAAPTVTAIALSFGSSPTPTIVPPTARPSQSVTPTPPVAPASPASPTVTATARPATAVAVPVASGSKRYMAPPTWILGPIQGSGEDDKFIADLLWNLDDKKIPITAFHFDSDRWQTCANNAEWRWNDTVLQRLRSHNPPIRALFWIIPLITTECREYGEAASQGFFVRNGDGGPVVTHSWQGTGSWIDFNNPQAVAYWHSLLDRIFGRAQGVIGGFYTDDLHQDIPGGTAYGNAFVRDLLNYTRSKVPDGDVVMKTYGVLTPDKAFMSYYGHASYVNDLDSTFVGMREGIRRVFETSPWLPAPFNELTGYNMRVPDAETYIRRMHWGAFQPIMENDSLPKNAVPWDPGYPPLVLQTYQYYAALHLELAPFFHTYDELAYLNNRPIFQQPNTARASTILGKEFFVQYVTDYGTNVQVTFPAGQWIDYWNEQQVYTGPATINYVANLGKEPIFIQNGSIIPMQVRDGATGHGTTASAGALTVNVFPSGHSGTSYYDVNKWLAFDVTRTGNQLTLCTSARPSQPLIYRIARWPSAPTKVTALQGAVGVDVNWGSPLPQLGDEAAVDASTGGWYYDAAHQHLIAKLTQTGSYCP